MKVLVTGGAGYVGSHCVRNLIDAGHSIVVLDNLVDGGHKEAVDTRAELFVADLADVKAVDKAFEEGGFDAVMHFAAHLNVGESVDNPLKYYQNNVGNTLALLSLMSKHHVQRMVFSSSCATYGTPPTCPMTEGMPKVPISPYGRTKLVVEWALEDSATAWKLGATAMRYFNASGASSDGTIGEDRDPEYHLIPVVLEVALGQRDQLKIFGHDYPTPDGTCVRDYIHVEDLADAHRLALESQPEGEFRAFNVGTGRGTSVSELIVTAREVTGHAIPTVQAARRPGDPPALYADPGKIKRELGWEPRFVDIREIVQSAWDWHCKHPDGYSSRP